MIYELKNIKSRAATFENKYGEAGQGGKSRKGRKGSPCIEHFMPGNQAVLLETEGPGIVRHIWLTIPPNHPEHLRNMILRIYWDGQETPSVEVPIGDFFGVAHGLQRHLITRYITMQDGRGFNCHFPMPFQKHTKITVENDSDSEIELVFYQIDYSLGDELGENVGYFHAQFRRQNPCPLNTDYTILDGIEGKGVYVGTVLGIRNCFTGHLDEWWGEGEVKFYIDDDEAFPTICGTGTEDYIGSGWGTEETVTPDKGAVVMDNERGYYSLFRFHIDDPIYFQKRLKVTIQQLGAGNEEKARKFYGQEGNYYRAVGTKESDGICIFERSDDYSSVAYWYQELPTVPFPALPSKTVREENIM